MQSPTDPEDVDIHDVYARYGLAMFQAQCVERQLVIVVPAMLKVNPTNLSREDFNKLLDRLYEQTMGRTIRELEQRTGLPAGLEVRIREALRLRNWLAHDYFWERAAQFHRRDGRAKMKVELDETTHFLDELHTQLLALGAEWRRSVGITGELVAAEMTRFLADPSAT